MKKSLLCEKNRSDTWFGLVWSGMGGIIVGSQQKKAGSPHIRLVCGICLRNNKREQIEMKKSVRNRC